MRKRILLVQQVLGPPGGANAVAAWILEALKGAYEITVLADHPVELAEVNRFYGTSLVDSDLDVIYPNRWINGLLHLDPDPNSIQPVAYLMRVCRRIRDRFDLVIAAGTEEMDLGGPGLLYVHYPHLARFWKDYRDGRSGWPGLLRGQTRPWMLLAGYSIDRMKENTLLTNSEWTRREIREAYGVTAEVVYPPVTATHSPLPWQERENWFVCTGRLHAKKRMDWIVDVLGRVRERHPEVRLHLVGTRDRGKSADAYYRKLRSVVEANGQWVELHEDLTRNGLSELLGRSRYGIHALVDEHFGIAPAEMLMAGCIPFVHDSGGQVEIVGRDARLCFTESDVVDKIGAVLSSETTQASVQESLARTRELFTVERFKSGVRSAVECAIARRKAAPAVRTSAAPGC